MKDIKENLLSILEETKLPNWDGYGASPVTKEVIEACMLFYRLLPKDCLDFELSPSPDGSISFEWYGEKGRIVSAGVEVDRVVYAYIIGRDKGSGDFVFKDRIREGLINLIRRIKE